MKVSVSALILEKFEERRFRRAGWLAAEIERDYGIGLDEDEVCHCIDVLRSRGCHIYGNADTGWRFVANGDETGGDHDAR